MLEPPGCRVQKLLLFLNRLSIAAYLLYRMCTECFIHPEERGLSKQRLAVTVRQSRFSYAVVEDTAYVGPSDVCGYHSCGIVRLASSPERRSHWQTISTANI